MIEGTLTGLLPARPGHWSETFPCGEYRQGTVLHCRIHQKQSLVRAAENVKHLTVWV